MQVVAVAAVTLALCVSLGALACNGSRPAAPAASSTAATPDLTPRPTSTPVLQEIPVVGLFSDPRPAPVAPPREIAPPKFEFGPWDGQSVVLDDTLTGVETNLGPGQRGSFSPDSRRMVWVAGSPPLGENDIWVVDLATTDKREIGRGAGATFLDDNRVVIGRPSTNEADVFDLRTGTLVPYVPPPTPTPPARYWPAPPGYVLTAASDSGNHRYDYVVTDIARVRVLRLEAAQTAPAGTDALVVAIGPWPKQGETRVTNLFLLHLDTGDAQFIATAVALDAIAANDEFVVWAENFCGIDAGPRGTFVYNRESGGIASLGEALRLYPTADGNFQGTRWSDSPPSYDSVLVDLREWRYEWIIRGFTATLWSPDGRYGSRGQNALDGSCT